jgi:hypothetical protein
MNSDSNNSFALHRRPQLAVQLARMLGTKEHQMSAPSRRPEIRRRRVRNEKVTKLRKRIATASSEAERSRLIAKLALLARKSPGQPLVKAAS